MSQRSGARYPRPLARAFAYQRVRCGVAVGALMFVAVACDRSASRAAADSAAVAVTGATDTAAPAESGVLPVDDCPLSGAWQQCKVEKRLEQSGLVPVLLPAAAHEPVTSVPALVYQLGRAELHVWILPDSGARAAEQARLDPATSQPSGSLRRWGRPAVLIASNNLLAVLLSENERTTERIQLALTAGLPPG